MGGEMQKWHCTEGAKYGKDARTLVVMAQHWQDARTVAAAKLGVPELGELLVVPCSDDHRPDIEVRHVGDDFGHGGSPNARRRETRERIGDEWGTWKAFI